MHDGRANQVHGSQLSLPSNLQRWVLNSVDAIPSERGSQAFDKAKNSLDTHSVTTAQVSQVIDWLANLANEFDTGELSTLDAVASFGPLSPSEIQRRFLADASSPFSTEKIKRKKISVIFSVVTLVKLWQSIEAFKALCSGHGYLYLCDAVAFATRSLSAKRAQKDHSKNSAKGAHELRSLSIRKFKKLINAYRTRYPSANYVPRNALAMKVQHWLVERGMQAPSIATLEKWCDLARQGWEELPM